MICLALLGISASLATHCRLAPCSPCKPLLLSCIYRQSKLKWTVFVCRFMLNTNRHSIVCRLMVLALCHLFTTSWPAMLATVTVQCYTYSWYLRKHMYLKHRLSSYQAYPVWSITSALVWLVEPMVCTTLPWWHWCFAHTQSLLYPVQVASNHRSGDRSPRNATGASHWWATVINLDINIC